MFVVNIMSVCKVCFFLWMGIEMLFFEDRSAILFSARPLFNPCFRMVLKVRGGDQRRRADPREEDCKGRRKVHHELQG